MQNGRRCGHPGSTLLSRSSGTTKQRSGVSVPKPMTSVAGLEVPYSFSGRIQCQDDLDAIADSLDIRPRATCDWRTPLEVFAQTLAGSHQPSSSVH